MKYFLVFMILYGVFANDSKIAYDNYSVYRVVPTTDKQLSALKQLDKSDSGVSILIQ